MTHTLVVIGWRGLMLLRDRGDALLAIADPPPSGGSARNMND